MDSGEWGRIERFIDYDKKKMMLMLMMKYLYSNTTQAEDPAHAVLEL